MDAIEEYRERRKRRLGERIAATVESYKRRRVERIMMRLDADDDESGNNNNRGGGSSASSGGHGNTRLPFGLCRRFGIEIGADWGPKEAWEALSEKGIVAGDAYARLKRGEDPGVPTASASGADDDTSESVEEQSEAPEPVKEPVKTFEEEGRTFGDLEARPCSWSKEYYYTLTGKADDGRTFWRRFRTREDLYLFLKEKGVEEFIDPSTKDTVNPQEMELPRAIMSAGYGSFKDVSIGYVGGRYAVKGTFMDDKKRTWRDFGSLSEAMEALKDEGVAEEDIRLSPALKKREKDRVAWLTSDKKEWITGASGTRYGDLSLEYDGWRTWVLTGESEEGKKIDHRFASKTDAMKFLKDQGCEKVRVEKSAENPMEYTIPDSVAKIGDREYQKVFMQQDRYGDICLYGKDLDGTDRVIYRQMRGESYDEFKNRIQRDCGIDMGIVDVDETAQKAIDRKIAEDAERERIRKEWEEKSVPFGYSRYVNPQIVPSEYSDDEFRLIGYGKDGSMTRITSGDSMYGLVKYIKDSGHDPETFIKDDRVREAYDKYVTAQKEFESKATLFGGRRYLDLKAEYDGGMYKVTGTDDRGIRRTVARSYSYTDFMQRVEDGGADLETLPKDDRISAKIDRVKRGEAAVAAGTHYAFVDKDGEVYSDIKIEVDHGDWTVWGKDIDGEEKHVSDRSSWDDAVEYLESRGIRDYTIMDGGTVMRRPTDGMHDVVLARNPETGTYKILATSAERGGSFTAYEGKTEEECRQWLRDNNVPDKHIGTRGMNPNDDVPRTHTERSLSSFDSHRMKQISSSYMDKMSSEDKKDIADMLTEVFEKNPYRVVRSPNSFGGIIENGYKSQMETGTAGSGAVHSYLRRKDVSERLFGHSKIGDAEYEKCGYIGMQDETADADDTARPMYGSITYTLRKDRMKDRTTYTFGDSLNRIDYLSSAGYAGDHPTIEGMTALSGAGPAQKVLKAYRQYKKGEISYDEMFRSIRQYANNEYIELQFHGAVTAADIERVSFLRESYLRTAFDTMTPERRKSVLKKLKANGIQIVYRTAYGEPFKDAWDWIRQKYPADIPEEV